MKPFGKIVKTIDGLEEKLVRIMEGIRAIRNTMSNVAIDEEAVREAIAIARLEISKRSPYQYPPKAYNN